jgi:DNA-binding transcriptional MerR regulator
MSTFRSGIAARLSGIPVQTLRVWERRYQLTDAKLPGGHQRLYSHKDVERLALIKQLVDLGQSIGSLASLDLSSLQTLRSTMGGLPAGSGRAETRVPGSKVRVGLVGILLERITLTAGSAANPQREEVRAGSLEAMRRNQQPEIPPVDAALIEIPNLLEESAETVVTFHKENPATHLLVFYRFAPSAMVRRLRSRGISVMRMPADETELSEACDRFLKQAFAVTPSITAASVNYEAKAQKYSIETLLTLTRIESAVFCECPRQLAQLLLSISSFEDYSAHCANRDSDDALIHRRLQSDAAVVRSLLEESLARLLSYEDIDVSALSRDAALKNSE